MGVFGRGIAKHFMMPYNFKVWAHPPRMMNKEWIGERVSVVDISRVLTNVILDKDDAGWGPNSTFKYPRFGGTGGLFERIVRTSRKISAQLRRRARRRRAEGSRPRRRNARAVRLLMSTIPVDRLVHGMGERRRRACTRPGRRLRHSGSYIVGVG